MTGVLDERPTGASKRIAVILNGLGRSNTRNCSWWKDRELLTEAGYVVVDPEVGELVTSLHMAGCSSR